MRTRRTQVQAALAEVEGYHAVAGSLQSKQLLGEARGNLSKMNHISHVRCAAHDVQAHGAHWLAHVGPQLVPSFEWLHTEPDMRAQTCIL